MGQTPINVRSGHFSVLDHVIKWGDDEFIRRGRERKNNENRVDLFMQISTAYEEDVPNRFFKPKAELLINTLDEKVVITGGCWDYVDAVYSRDRRRVIFKGTLQNGPYANKDVLKPGDWLYHINHSYNGIERSGIFIKWLDKKSAIGLLSPELQNILLATPITISIAESVLVSAAV